MSVKISKFGAVGSQSIEKITIDNGTLRASVISLGATLQELFVPDKNGVVKDVVCGYDNVEDYLSESGYLGATVGRYANRINAGKFYVDGVEYNVFKNEQNASLHGGKVGFSHKLWSYEAVGDNAVKFTIVSPDGDESYPGELTLSVTYELSESTLALYYEATATKNTPVNVTNHSYFNLDGFDSGSTLSHKLYIPASHYDEVNSDLIPIGRPTPVKGTDFDFQTERVIEKDYDHNFVLDKGSAYGIAARLTGNSGRVCEVYTDLPAIQIYNAGGLSGKPMKGGVKKIKNGAVCLETQYSPNTPNRPYMPSCIYGPDRKLETVTKFVFSVK